MAHIITFAATKGGPGKSTLSAEIALIAHEDGNNVAFIDLDAQETLTMRFEARDTDLDGPTALSHINAKNFNNEIKAVLNDYDIIIIDTPGVVDASVTKALNVSDLIAIPLRASKADINSLGDILSQIDNLNLTKKAGFILNQVRGSRAVKRTIEAIMGEGQFFGIIGCREVYVDAGDAGVSVSELGSNKKAIEEVTKVYKSICRHLNK